MAKKIKKVNPVYRLPLGNKKGRKKVPALINLVDHKDLGISKSYYNRIKKKVNDKTVHYTPTASIISKLQKIHNVRSKYGIEVRDGDKSKITIPRKFKEALKGSKEKRYIQVILQLSSAGRIYHQSFHVRTDQRIHLSARLNKYIDLNVKKYDKFPVHILSISFKNV